MSKTIHVHMDTKGAILNFKAREWRNVVRRAEGEPFLTPAEVKAWLLDELAKGHTAIPFGEPCKGFSFTTGCPGHAEPLTGGPS